MMVDQNLDEEIVKNFRQWDCYVVWSIDAQKLRDISAYYNRVNHFVALKPSWSTNILGARKVWELMGRPRNPKEAAPIATRSNVRRNAESAANKKKFTEFSSAMYKRFAQLDVLKAQRTAKGKDAKDKLEIRNELKIITAPDDVYNLWSKVISSAAHGELHY